MTTILLIKNCSWRQFLKDAHQLNFKYLATKIRLVLPTLASYNKMVLLNDGLPLEFIVNNFKSNKIVTNSDINIVDFAHHLIIEQQLAEQLNQFVAKFTTDHLIIVSLSGQNNHHSGGISLDDLEVPVLFIGNKFINSSIDKSLIYTINDLAITINDFSDTTVTNARGQVIKFLAAKEQQYG